MVQANTVEIDGVGQVLFERSYKAKNLNISVKPFTVVRVAVPDGLSFQKAEELVYTKRGWIQRQLVRMKRYEDKAEAFPVPHEDIDRAQVKHKLKRRLRYLAAKNDLTYNRVFIRNQKTRWGSCSSKNNISLNIKISRLPEEMMDYVILHELAHTRVKNHSNEFWALLNKLVGNGKEKAIHLREYGMGYL